MIKKGDRVRFLNAVGGGVVTRIDEKKGLVYVEDNDGFEVPALERECVVVPTVVATTNMPLRDFSSPSKSAVPVAEESTQQNHTPVFEEAETYETPEGDEPKYLLAFLPKDIKQLQSSSYECYLVNDSNYFVFYNIVSGTEEAKKSIAHGLIEPNMQECLLDIEKEELNDWSRIHVQMLAFKRNKNYPLQPSVDEEIKIHPVSFYKSHSFTENDYFEEAAMLVEVGCKRKEKTEKEILRNLSSESLREAVLSKEKKGELPRRRNKRPLKAEIIEVDLHSAELLDTTAGMSNADILEYQLNKFHETLNTYKNKRGQRIVFIHGKGEGVLRKEIENSLKTRYKSYHYQDASFREYGFGATLVMIR